MNYFHNELTKRNPSLEEKMSFTIITFFVGNTQKGYTIQIGNYRTLDMPTYLQLLLYS